MAAAQHDIEAVRARLRYDTPFWAGGVVDGKPPGRQAAYRGCAKIVDKSARLVPLVATPWQLELDAALEAQRAKGLPMRAIILKARQLGFSTWVEAKMIQRLTQIPYQRGVIVAHDVKTAGAIFDMSELMYNHLPTEEELGLGFSIKPALTGISFSPNGRKFMEFGETTSRRMRERGRTGKSILDIDTANAPEGGRGTTRHIAHLSEVAKWPDTATQGTRSKMISILNSVPYLPETLVVLESTANGLNHFARRWDSAVEGADDPDTGETYVAIFVPWWRDPNYALSFATLEDRERFEKSIGTGPYGDDEPRLVEEYGCTPEQLYWRRMQIRTQHEDNIALFKQENPASPEEAFIGSGRTVFSSILVEKTIQAAAAAPAPVLGTLRATEHETRRTRSGTVEVPTSVVWVPEHEAAREEPLLSVWEHPVTAESLELLPAGERGPVGAYVVAADVAEGEANTFTEGDFHAVQVFDHRSRMQVAVHESRMDIHLLPLWCLLIAIYYNRAWLAPEVNGPGIALTEVLGKDYRYGRLFRRRRIDSSRNVVEDKIGWKTDLQSKPVLESTFGQAMQEEVHGIRHLRTARQLNTYVVDERGRHGAQAGENDDLLMSAMIAQQVMQMISPPRERKGRVAGYSPHDDLTGY